MKSFIFLLITCLTLILVNCDDAPKLRNITAIQEQAQTEENQSQLNTVQPAPRVTWSMERDNLIKLKKLQNDRSINFFMYVFNEGIGEPIGYYLVNKVSSVDSQLTNTMQLVTQWSRSGSANGHWIDGAIPSPSEDGSYGTNGDGVFGFTPEGICIQTNMHYICSSVPLNFPHAVTRLAVISTAEAKTTLDASLKAMQ
jgi:hypothetical protein